jgi:hypothetical protein
MRNGPVAGVGGFPNPAGKRPNPLTLGTRRENLFCMSGSYHLVLISLPIRSSSPSFAPTRSSIEW